MFANYAQNKLNLTYLLKKRFKNEHLCILVCIGTNLEYKENF